MIYYGRLLMKRYRITITGIVQGVGFRPFIFNLANNMELKGWVGNTDSNVIIEIETGENRLEEFLQAIKSKAPVLSNIESIVVEELKPVGFEQFGIKESQSLSKGNIFISPDVSTCKDCINEIKDPQDRRYMYPFTNCTNCGPRFTIIKDIPYDRDKTTMSSFQMCESCNGEYTNPADRRYHAQPVSCHACGPELGLADDMGKPMNTREVDCLAHTAEVIAEGKIAAIKGIGGYHLACDGLSSKAVKRLRQRKHRDDKPFALMMKSIEVVYRYCYVTSKERELLESPASPVVLLRKKDSTVFPEDIAPLNRYLGVMLPYTPIHHLLFEQKNIPEVLVMTSGNISSEPIFYRDEDAINGLIGIADIFLTNNREIYIRTDDSVSRVFRDREYLIRRSRGYVPAPIRLDLCKLLGIDQGIKIPSVLACGGELKNVFCINKGNLFYLSHHIGDLENESTNKAFIHAVEHFKKLFSIEPDKIAYDLHPGYFSTQFALGQELELKTGIQHHKAHIAACMADNELSGEVIGVAFDGTGFGEDGMIWGGEFFVGGYFGFERAGRLSYVPMPGGDSAVKQPWRMALGYLYTAGLMSRFRVGEDSEGSCRNSSNPEAEKENAGILKEISRQDIAFIGRMLEKKLNCPETSSMGRFFDAVSALLGIKTDISYEGQAAIELEYYATDSAAKPYKVVLEKDEAGAFVVRTDLVIKELVRDLDSGSSREELASKFHATIAEIILQGCISLRDRTQLNRVVLSGGVFQNLTLLTISCELLEKNGFVVYTHTRVPANDGGIALGQAIIAVADELGKT